MSIDNNNMLWSVVIPTMWKSSRTIQLISHISRSELVSEVIVIDNDPSQKPIFQTSKKVKILAQEKNIYVNPAWNLGVKNSSQERIVLCNDDVTFDISILEFINQNLDINNSIIGCHPLSFELKTKVPTQIFVEKGHYIGGGWGCILFFSKKNYKNIPLSIKIWHGDDWLAGTHKFSYSILHPVATEMSVTSSNKIFEQILLADAVNFQKLTSIFVKYRAKFSHASKDGELSFKRFIGRYIRHVLSRITT